MNILRQYQTDKKLSGRQLADIVGYSPTYMSTLLRKDNDYLYEIPVTTAVKIKLATGIDLFELALKRIESK